MTAGMLTTDRLQIVLCVATITPTDVWNALMNFYLVQISGICVHMALSNTTLHFQLHRRSLLWSHCYWTDTQINYSYTQQRTHCSSDKHYVPTNKNKKKRRRIPSSAQYAYIKKWNFKQQIFQTRKTACCLTGRHKVTQLRTSINAISFWCVWRTEMHTGFWWGQLIDRD